MQKHFDTIISIPCLRDQSNVQETVIPFIPNQRMSELIAQTVRAITDLIVEPKLVCIDLLDVKWVLECIGMGVMGFGKADGPDRARIAARNAISSPTLNGLPIGDADGILINITGGYDISLCEIDEVATMIRDLARENVDIVFSAIIDKSLENNITVTIILAGIPYCEHLSRRVKVN